ncbi:hypothetical protein L6452_32610 [Arctium lappa]|uniref:Uncharacterized protein n=1 Tax=Arctium lappa TaxID=4217 RepID=A0ACB8Z5G3_ARCLA|nr:hypothetical protein L6452_32610 [Arctium lappa]
MESRNSEMPCKIRKRRFPTASSSSFTNDNISQLLVGKTPSHSPGNEKCFNMLDRSNCKEQELEADHNRVNKVIIDKSITNVDRSRNKSRTSSGRLPAPEVINPRYKNPCSFVEKDKSFGGMHSIIDATLFEVRAGS